MFSFLTLLGSLSSLSYLLIALVALILAAGAVYVFVVLHNWKPLAAAGVALMIVAGVYAGARHVDGLYSEIAAKQVEVAQQKLRGDLEAAAKAEIERQHAEQLAKVEALEKAKADTESEVAALRDKVRAPDVQKEMKDDPNKGAAAFARRSTELNRVLHELSKGKPRAHGASRRRAHSKG